MVEMIRSDIEKALSEHSATAVGRLHQTLVQLLDSGGGMLGIPLVFTQAISVFIRAKVEQILVSNDRFSVVNMELDMVSAVLFFLFHSLY